jgi:lambda family phage tail tape measure protein
MADTTYKIAVDTAGAVSSINGLKSALGLLAAAFSIREVVEFADGITNLRNKLLTLTPDVQVVNQQFKALAAIAIQARTPLEATADLFFRIQRASKALGISSKEAAQITESVAKAISSSGLSAAEASGPLLQLGQALQSGTFQGDELRSILEGLPPVANALAQELNVPVGALKKLGSEGQISADVFVKAMRRARDSIEEAFGRTTPTITSAIEGLKTNAKIAFDEFEKNTQTGRNLALAIEYLGFQIFKLTKNIDAIIEPFMTVVKILAAFAAFTIAGRIIAAFGGILDGVAKFFIMFRAAASNAKDMLLQFPAVIAAVGANFTGLYNVLKMILRPVLMLVEKFGALAVGLATFLGLDSVIEWFKNLGKSTEEGGSDLEAYRKELEKMKEGLDDTASASENAAAQAKELAKQYARLRQAAEFEVDNLNRTLSQERQRLDLENKFTQMRIDGIGDTQDQLAVDQARQRVAQDMYNAQQRINQEIQKLNLEYSQLAVQDSVRGKEIRNQISVLQFQREENKKIYTDHEEGMAKLIRDQLNLKSIEEARKRINEDIVAGIDREIQKQQDLDGILKGINQQIQQISEQRPEFAMSGFNTLQRQLLKIEDDARIAAQRAAEQFAQGFGEISPLNEADFSAGLDAIIQAYKELVNVQQEAAKEQYNIQRTFEYGWRDALSKFAEDAFDRSKEARSYFDTFVSGFESAITRFVQTGKFSIKDLVNSMLAEFAKLAAKRMLFNFLGASGLGSFFGAGGGGGSAGATVMGLPGFAKGGYLPSGQMGIVGEYGPELITGPANISPMDQQQPVTVNYNIQAVDASSFRALVARDPEFIYNITEQGRRSQPTRRLA